MRILLEFTGYLMLDATNKKGLAELLSGNIHHSADFQTLKLLVLAGADINAKRQIWRRRCTKPFGITMTNCCLSSSPSRR